MSYGAYPDAEGGYAMAPGVWNGSQLAPVAIEQITEDACHSWLVDDGTALPPATGLTLPHIEKPDAYTWNKAPRLNGQVLETGAMARRLANGQPLIRALWRSSGGNVLTRVLARALELAGLILLVEDTLRAVVPDAACCVDSPVPQHADAYGLCEAARGSLGHWLSIRNGRIANYQIVAPTSWNFSPRDRAGTPGALEAALVGTPVLEGDKTPVAVQHIVRSFDPCMVCTVH
jgi:hydrogenase large subunit